MKRPILAKKGNNKEAKVDTLKKIGVLVLIHGCEIMNNKKEVWK